MLQQAELMMEGASSTRQYTTEELKPLLQQSAAYESTFLPQTVPAYGATVTFAPLRKKFPEYTYKEATLNPTNLADRAVDWETDVIEHFRNRAQSEGAGRRADDPHRDIALPGASHRRAAELSRMPQRSGSSPAHHD